MSFLSALGKIGKAALNIGTGGVAGTIMDAVGDVGSVLGKQQAGAAQGRAAQANADLSHDRNAIDLYQAQQGAQDRAGQLDLDRKNHEIGSRGTNAKQALIGALLGGGMQGTKIGPGGASGGLLASLNGNPDALAAMKLLGSQAHAAQDAPMAFTGGEILQAPTLTPVPQVDKGGFLSTLANIGQLAGAAGAHLPQGGQRPQIPDLQAVQGLDPRFFGRQANPDQYGA